jgi:ribonuclease P/MRP protein subunit POP1
MKKAKQLLKQKRYRQYEQINEEMTSVGLNISEIKIEDFVESRKKELTKFQDILKHKFTTKHGHQLLPHHMRRRQMSHNPFRIPRLFRLANLTVNVKSKCKKHKKKLVHLKKSLIRRARRQNWL